MPKKSVYRARHAAFRRQAERCCYCSVLMWIDDAVSFAVRHGLTRGIVRGLQCTAEHLRAKQDGGRDTADNIAAACWLCNHRRHARKAPLSPKAYRRLVRRRVSQQCWHPAPVYSQGLVPN